MPHAAVLKSAVLIKIRLSPHPKVNKQSMKVICQYGTDQTDSFSNGYHTWTTLSDIINTEIRGLCLNSYVRENIVRDVYVRDVNVRDVNVSESGILCIQVFIA